MRFFDKADYYYREIYLTFVLRKTDLIHSGSYKLEKIEK